MPTLRIINITIPSPHNDDSDEAGVNESTDEVMNKMIVVDSALANSPIHDGG